MMFIHIINDILIVHCTKYRGGEMDIKEVRGIGLCLFCRKATSYYITSNNCNEFVCSDCMKEFRKHSKIVLKQRKDAEKAIRGITICK